MNEMRIVKPLVDEALRISEMARNSDNYLYYMVCKAKLAARGIDIDQISFTDALLRKNELSIPIFESCRRARQKAQRANPDLAASDEVEAMRTINERKVRKFARTTNEQVS